MIKRSLLVAILAIVSTPSFAGVPPECIALAERIADISREMDPSRGEVRPGYPRELSEREDIDCAVLVERSDDVPPFQKVRPRLLKAHSG